MGKLSRLAWMAAQKMRSCAMLKFCFRNWSHLQLVLATVPDKMQLWKNNGRRSAKPKIFAPSGFLATLVLFVGSAVVGASATHFVLSYCFGGSGGILQRQSVAQNDELECEDEYEEIPQKGKIKMAFV